MPSYDKADLQRRMHGAVEVLKHDLVGLRTGRASTALLDPIQVEVYGAHMPLNQCATISVPEPRLITVQVWDKGNVGPIEKAIRSAGLGAAFTPSLSFTVDGTGIYYDPSRPSDLEILLGTIELPGVVEEREEQVEEQLAVGTAGFRLLQDLQAALRQRNDMLAAAFHPLLRDRPERRQSDPDPLIVTEVERKGWVGSAARIN